MSEREKPVYYTPEGRPVYPSETEALLREQRQRDFEYARSLEPRREGSKSRGYPPDMQRLADEMRARQAEQDRQPSRGRGNVLEMRRRPRAYEEKLGEERKVA